MEAEPRTYRAIMVSSTFTDLEAHRREAIDAIHRFGFHANVMEYSGARSDADVIDASLRMVRDSVAYLCVIGHKYGQTPVNADRNPNGLSITELEFNEARKLDRPILLFLMGDEHPVMPGDVELDAKKRKKLLAFRKQAKRIDPASERERVYDTFASKDEFAKKAAMAVGLEAIRMIGGSDIADRAVERQLAPIAGSDNRVAALKVDAEAALTKGDLDKARAAYREAAEAARNKAAELVRTAAELKSAEAEAHLLALDWEAADSAWTEAATMLAPFDPDAADDLVENAGERLSTHGEIYARAGAMRAAIKRWRALAASAETRGDEREAARLRNNLGSGLGIQGERTGGPEGLRLLDEAVRAYRDALTVRTRADLAADWAMTKNNLGIALGTQGERTGGPAGLRLLGEAVRAYRDALTVRTLADMPSDWAMTQNNLATALQAQGQRTDGPEGLSLLEEAVRAYRDALTVRTRADTPAEWAMTQNNLGTALRVRGQRTDGPEGLRLLEEAVTAYREALTVRTRADMPADWATTQNNLGNALQTQSRRTAGPESLRLLDEAVTVYRDALTVHTHAEMPAQWAITQENIGLAREAMAEADPDRARAHLLEAEAALVAALGIYTPEHMAFYHDKATASLARVRAKLAALDA